VSKSSSNRPQKVGQLIQKELGNLLIEGLKDPRIGFATITEVRVTGDLRQAKVFVSVYGTQEEREQSVAGLTAAAGYLKREMGKALRLRFLPDLIFALDTSLDQAHRLEEIINAIESGDKEIPETELNQTVPVATDRKARGDSAERIETDLVERQHRQASKVSREQRRRFKRSRN
tara:strand:+ start:195 stop:719 length:525 start_codon:yes stop_codon:yes gene_type:complete